LNGEQIFYFTKDVKSYKNVKEKIRSENEENFLKKIERKKHKKEENQYFSDMPYVFINMDNACVDNVMYGWQL